MSGNTLCLGKMSGVFKRVTRDALIKTTIMLNKNYSHSVEQELHLC